MKEQSKPRKKPSKVFTKKLFIPSAGFVQEGDKVTPELEKAWKSWTKVSISDYTK